MSEAQKERVGRRAGVVSVLDIGTNKVCCMIARATPRQGGDALGHRTHDIEVLGVGYQRSRGVKNGAIVDIASAETAIRHVVDAAEQTAGMTVGSMLVNVSSGALTSHTHEATVDLGGQEVERGDVARVLRAALRKGAHPDAISVHSLPTGYSLDGTDEIIDPTGMVGEKLSVSCHVTTGEVGPVRNLERVVNRAHLEVERMVATPYASALAAVVDDEAELGCVAIDMGAGTTSWAIMSNGRFVHGDALTVGGQHVTTDIARGLSTSIEQAERLKVMEASVAPRAGCDEPIAVRPLADDTAAAMATVPRLMLDRIARARLEETFELVRDRIRSSGFGRHADRRVVLTGGGSQLTGAADLARRILAKNVRIGRPVGVRGLSPTQKTPAFAAVVGLLIYPQVAEHEQHARLAPFSFPSNGPLARIGGWFKGF